MAPRGRDVPNGPRTGLRFPHPLRFQFARRSAIMGWVLGIVYRVIATHLIKKAG